MPADIVIKLRGGTAAEWTAANPVLAAREMGIETDTQRSKFGDGVTAWSSLSYTVGDSSGIGTIDWTSVLNKPTEFDPVNHAADHELGGVDEIEIAQSQVTGLDTALAGKSDVGHAHVMNDITDLEFPPTTILSDTAPLNPVEATRWIDTTNFIEYIYYDSYWVEV